MGTRNNTTPGDKMNFKGLTRSLTIIVGMLVAVPYLMILAVE
jgi:hypothetical protein